jgi:hypothetical protein
LKQFSTSSTETCLKGQRSGLLALLILIYLTIYSVAYLGEVLTDPLTKNQSLITAIMEVFSNIPREVLKRVNTLLNNSEQYHYAAIPIFLVITISIFI